MEDPAVQLSFSTKQTGGSTIRLQDESSIRISPATAVRWGSQITERQCNPNYTPKPSEQRQYPGKRIQINMKFVPAACAACTVDDKNTTKTQRLMRTAAIIFTQ